MTEENQSAPLELDVDLTAVDTSMPVLVPGLKELAISAISRVPNKDQTGYNLLVVFETCNPEETRQGKTVKPGFKIRARYHLQNKPDAEDPNQWKQNLAMLQEAALGAKQATFTAADLIGRKVIGDVKVEEYEGQFSNKVNRLTAPR